MFVSNDLSSLTPAFASHNIVKLRFASQPTSWDDLDC